MIKRHTSEMIEAMLEASHKAHDEKKDYHDNPKPPEGKEVARGVYRTNSGMLYIGDKL